MVFCTGIMFSGIHYEAITSSPSCLITHSLIVLALLQYDASLMSSKTPEHAQSRS